MGLLKLRVTAACSQSWDRMAGDGRERFCSQCALRVRNLSEMSEKEALSVIAGADERLCVRFDARADGTVILRRRWRWLGHALRAASLAVLAVLFWTGVVLVQRPWQTLARKVARPMPPFVPQPRPPDPEGEELERRLKANQEELLREATAEVGQAWTTLGAVSSGDRDRIRFQLQRQRHVKR